MLRNVTFLNRFLNTIIVLYFISKLFKFGITVLCRSYDKVFLLDNNDTF